MPRAHSNYSWAMARYEVSATVTQRRSRGFDSQGEATATTNSFSTTITRPQRIEERHIQNEGDFTTEQFMATVQEKHIRDIEANNNDIKAGDIIQTDNHTFEVLDVVKEGQDIWELQLQQESS